MKRTYVLQKNWSMTVLYSQPISISMEMINDGIARMLDLQTIKLQYLLFIVTEITVVFHELVDINLNCIFKCTTCILRILQMHEFYCTRLRIVRHQKK